MKIKTKKSLYGIPVILFLSIGFLLSSCGKQGGEGDLSLLQSSIIVGDLDWKDVSTLSSSNPVRVNSFAVGDVDLPAMGGRCTGFLISESVVMTNHHCIPTSAHARGVTVAFKHEKGVSKSGWNKFDCSTFIGNNRELDFALLKCSGYPGREFGVVSLDSDPVQVQDSIYVVQQNCDYYSNRSCDWYKKYSSGKISKIEDEYTHNADTLGGSSGSPVFAWDTHSVVAIHHAGNGNNGMGRGYENYAVPMTKIVPYILSHFPQVDLGQVAPGGDSGGPTITDGNDSFQKASTLVPSSQSVFKKEISDKEDVDFYKVVLPQSGELEVSISFKHSTGDLDLRLYDSSKKMIAKSESTSNQESIVKEVESGTYYVKVFGYKGATGKYELQSDFQASASQTSDNNSIETASSFSVGKTLKGEISSKEDVDYFKFTLSQRKTVAVSLSFSHSSGDLDLFLLDESGAMIDKSAGVKDSEKVEKSLKSGTYYVLVKGYKGAKGKYHLSVK